MMAGWAKGNKVLQCICFAVVFIFAIDVAKLTEGDNMMDIRLFAKLFTSYAATLAGVTVAGASALALALPVGAVVGVPTTLPVWMMLAGDVLGGPSSTAIKIAEMLFAAQDFTSWALQRGITVSAINVNITALPAEGIFASLGFAYPLAIAGRIAKVRFVLRYTTARSHQWRAAAGAFDLDLAKKVMGFATFIFRAPFVPTSLAAERALAVPPGRDVALEIFAAVLAGKLELVSIVGVKAGTIAKNKLTPA